MKVELCILLWKLIYIGIACLQQILAQLEIRVTISLQADSGTIIEKDTLYASLTWMYFLSMSTQSPFCI